MPKVEIEEADLERLVRSAYEYNVFDRNVNLTHGRLREIADRNPAVAKALNPIADYYEGN